MFLESPEDHAALSSHPAVLYFCGLIISLFVLFPFSTMAPNKIINQVSKQNVKVSIGCEGGLPFPFSPFSE
jgi:hypothetical protein